MGGRRTRPTWRTTTPREITEAFAQLNVHRDRADGTGDQADRLAWQVASFTLDEAGEAGVPTWADLSREASASVLVEIDRDRMRREIVRLVALHLAWLYALDRRAAWQGKIRVPQQPKRLRPRARR